MILKKITHFLCGRSLEKEIAKTNVLIREVEQHEKAARDRLQAKTDEYRAEVAAYRSARDAELNDFIQFLNEQIGKAEVYVLHLGDFQDKMFVCVDSWMSVSIVGQQIKSLSERIETNSRMLDFIKVLQIELNKLTQCSERAEWRKMIKERPIQASSTFIERTVRQVEANQKSSTASVQRDLNRLKSRSLSLQKEIEELRHERDQKITASKELMEKHNANKTDLRKQYEKCSKMFGEIKDRFSDRFGSAPTESNLANRWIAEIKDGVTLPKLISIHKGTAELQREACDEFNDIDERFNAIRIKIKESHEIKNFDTLDQDKVERDRLFKERKEVGDKRREISTAREVVYARGNALKEMLGKFELLHPDESIRLIVRIFSMGKDFDTYREIGVSTREDRRKHYERKNSKS